MKIFSGIRPTGNIHIGNYLGAIKQWVVFQEKNECVFCIADWHAITTPFEPLDLQKYIRESAIIYLTSGINPEKSIFFLQSQVKEHVELAWLLGSVIPSSELFRMTQYKEKSKELKSNPSAGLLNYPILMASDILLYQTDIVPVGKDQTQHVEFAREAARRFNSKFGETFKTPKAYIPEIGAKIMSLQNPRKKMSKSGSLKGCICLLDNEENIKQKIMSSVTDSGTEIKYDIVKKPGISNLLTIHSLFSKKSIQETEKIFKNKGYAELKKSLSNLLIYSLEPFRKAEKDLSTQEIKIILEKGAKKAKKIAQQTIEKARKRMGLL